MSAAEATAISMFASGLREWNHLGRDTRLDLWVSKWHFMDYKLIENTHSVHQ